MTKAAAFFPFLSHRSEGREVSRLSSLFPPHCHVLQTSSCLPRPSQMKSREQAQPSAPQTHPPPAGCSLLFSCSPVFPSVSLLSSYPLPAPAAHPLSCCFPTCSCFPAFLATPAAFLAGWLAPKPQPFYRAPMTCLGQRTEAASSPSCPLSLHWLPPADPAPRPGTGPTIKRAIEGDAGRVRRGYCSASLSQGCSNMVTGKSLVLEPASPQPPPPPHD